MVMIGQLERRFTSRPSLHRLVSCCYCSFIGSPYNFSNLVARGQWPMRGHDFVFCSRTHNFSPKKNLNNVIRVAPAALFRIFAGDFFRKVRSGTNSRILHNFVGKLYLFLSILFIVFKRAYSSSVERIHGMDEGGVQFPWVQNELYEFWS